MIVTEKSFNQACSTSTCYPNTGLKLPTPTFEPCSSSSLFERACTQVKTSGILAFTKRPSIEPTFSDLELLKTLGGGKKGKEAFVKAIKTRFHSMEAIESFHQIAIQALFDGTLDDEKFIFVNYVLAITQCIFLKPQTFCLDSKEAEEEKAFLLLQLEERPPLLSYELPYLSLKWVPAMEKRRDLFLSHQQLAIELPQASERTITIEDCSKTHLMTHYAVLVHPDRSEAEIKKIIDSYEPDEEAFFLKVSVPEEQAKGLHLLQAISQVMRRSYPNLSIAANTNPLYKEGDKTYLLLPSPALFSRLMRIKSEIHGLKHPVIEPLYLLPEGPGKTLDPVLFEKASFERRRPVQLAEIGSSGAVADSYRSDILSILIHDLDHVDSDNLIKPEILAMRLLLIKFCDLPQEIKDELLDTDLPLALAGVLNGDLEEELIQNLFSAAHDPEEDDLLPSLQNYLKHPENEKDVDKIVSLFFKREQEKKELVELMINLVVSDKT